MKEKILIVDDGEDDLNSMKLILEKQNYDVTTAENGEKAIKLIKKNHFNLIVLDIMMPGVSGYDVLKYIRDKSDRKVPVLYISVVPKGQVELKGAQGFIQKPYVINEFVSTVEKALVMKKAK